MMRIETIRRAERVMSAERTFLLTSLIEAGVPAFVANNMSLDWANFDLPRSDGKMAAKYGLPVGMIEKVKPIIENVKCNS